MIKELFMALMLLKLTEGTAGRPNFVIVLTDDQDIVLDGLSPMKKLQKYVKEEGVTFENAYTTTPICCPSRSSILTGLYSHNHGTRNNSFNGGCSGPTWQENFEPMTFGALLKRSGYHTFYAGKYLNQYGFKKSGGVSHVPAGWDWWIGLVGNSAYYNYTLSVNGSGSFRGDREEDYLTDVISDYSMEFLKSREIISGQRPFLMVVSTPSPHEPFVPAKRHMGTFESVRAPRTPNFNLPVGKTKHWLLRLPPTILPKAVIDEVDDIYRKRWETLLAVDEMVEAIIGRLMVLNLMKNTYVIFCSDNGFHLGQFAMPWDKRQPYETDIKIPLIVTGPQVPRNQKIFHPVLNIDLAPTILNLAEVELPGVKMDGASFLPLINEVSGVMVNRDFLIEYYGEGSDKSDGGCYSDANVKLCLEKEACKCFDSRNNTYKCIRRFQGDLNEIYCKFKDSEQFRELYNLAQDPYEINNLIPAIPSKYLGGYDRALSCIDRISNSTDKCFRTLL